MRRRDFVWGISGAALALPSAALPQQATVPVVAFIHSGASDALARYAVAFRQGLKQSGYIEHQNVVVEYHWLEGHYDRLPALLEDLIRRRVAVIATPDTTASLAAKAATATVPIVFGAGIDPVALGLVASLARPGGNATGVNFFSIEVDTKRVGLMHALLPAATRYAVMLDSNDPKTAESTTKSLMEVAPHLGLSLKFVSANSPQQIDAAFMGFTSERPDALFIAGDSLFASRAQQFATLTMRERLPASFTTRGMVEAGLLMNYGTDIVDMFRQIGVYAGSILKGAEPADLPVLQSTKFDFAINLRTARALGVTVPPSLLAMADDVIE